MKKTYSIKGIEEKDMEKFRLLTRKKALKQAFTQGEMFGELINSYTHK